MAAKIGRTELETEALISRIDHARPRYDWWPSIYRWQSRYWRPSCRGQGRWRQSRRRMKRHGLLSPSPRPALCGASTLLS
jgi:hypothetical protein